MLDLAFIRENPQLVEANARGRGLVEPGVTELLKRDADRRQTVQELEQMRAELKRRSKAKPSPEEVGELRSLGERIRQAEDAERLAAAAVAELLDRLPNMVLEGVPLGGAELNRVTHQWGEPRRGGSEHWQVPGAESWIEAEAAARVSGSRFVYLQGDLVRVYYALMRFSQDLALRHGYQPVVPPVLVKREAMYGSGFFPANEAESYRVVDDPAENGPTDDSGLSLYLIGTSESVLVARYADQTLDLDQPLRLTATTTCFRREAGSYGKDVKGLFRLHQFDKVEMVTICQPEHSVAEHDRMLALEEEFLHSLGLPYQVVLLAGGDAANQSAKTYDCEAFFAGQGRYRELSSTSNCTDYQARRLGIRYRAKGGSKAAGYAHTLNGTVCSMGRPLGCIIEHYQTATGFTVPLALRPYCGGLEHVGALRAA